MSLDTYMELYVRPLAGVVGIYGLYEPRSNTPKYVGKTTCMWSRYKSHVLSRDTSAKSLWVQSLRGRGEYPTIEVLEECLESSLDEREKYWIAQYFGNGGESVNSQQVPKSLGTVVKTTLRIGEDTHLALQTISLVSGGEMSVFLEDGVWDYLATRGHEYHGAISGIFAKRGLDFDAILKARTGK